MTDSPESSAPLVPPLTALQRLEASRASLRRYLIKSDRAEDKDTSKPSGVAGTVNGWINGLRTNPLTAAIVDAVQGWWYHHPLHTISKLGAGAARDYAEPYIRKYPLSCMGGALVVGVVAAKVKPWRWVIRPALFAGLSSHVVTRLLSDAPLEFVIDVLNRFKPRPDMPSSVDPIRPAPDDEPYAAAASQAYSATSAPKATAPFAPDAAVTAVP